MSKAKGYLKVTMGILGVFLLIPITPILMLSLYLINW